ncbi:hypothetical protein PUNSTDRAFT_137752 [Punctularia strigosozonata HHB-11173 SS5]|uniref:DUF6533 domain-containing protein n=1 Tax=Punctularia strigosozonata (strain HHB-11173) TaxID=741275 RepID=R7S4B7_PUNST|nr:uncharacterized protein PUNSTDRAFT_137752 [Punctularia strigosozonata HHB-11173 SS5]EIN05068.1 hypothetical protein PUNSTDRAFT_137752 [Punctularia strigosozonata HHB-11173 SS5]
MSEAVVPLQTYLRIVAASVFFYDFLVTVPSEIRLLRRQHNALRPSHACILFMLARYVGMAAVISATVIYFHGWTFSKCAQLIPIVGAFRAVLSTVTNFVLLWRTWAIWARNRKILIMLLIIMIPTTIFSYGFLFDQSPTTKNGSCTAVSGHTVFGQKWTFALANMCFDIVAFVVCSIRLIRNIKAEKGISGLSAYLLSEQVVFNVFGIFYFVIVMIGHALNVSFLLSKDPARSNSFLTFNVALTSIASQRIITSLSERVTLNPSTHGSRNRSASRSRSRATSKVRNPFRFVAGMRDNVQQPDVELGRARSLHRGNGNGIAIDVHQETHIAQDDELLYGVSSEYKSKREQESSRDVQTTSTVHFTPE